MKNNQYTATPNWFKDVQQQQQVVTTQTNYYIGGASGGGGLQSINLYNKFTIESYRLTVDDLLIKNTAIIAADTPLAEGEERPEDFISEIGNNVEATNWYTSYLISVISSTSLIANLKANSNRYGIVFYDEYNQPISGYTPIKDELVTIDVPEKARYFRCCHYIEPATEPVESTDSETEEPVEPTYEFYIEYTGMGNYEDSDLNTAYGGIFENFTNVNSSVPEGINTKQLSTSGLNLIFQQPLSCTVDKNNNIKISLDKVFTDSIGNIETIQGLWKLIEDEQGNKYIITDYNIVGKGGITAYYNDDLNPGGSGGLGGGGSIANIQVIGKGNALSDVTLSEDKSLLTFTKLEVVQKDWITAELRKYVDKESAQEITGLKNFINGLSIGSKLLNVIDGVLYINCDVAVTGGVTTYALGSTDVSTIMDGIVTDNITITVQEINGIKKLVVIGGTGNTDVDELWNLLSAATDEQINKSHLTTALTEYATESWVTSKGYLTSVSWNDVKNKPSWITDTNPSYTKTESDNKYLLKSTYTAQDILSKLKTVDGTNSGLDADTLDGIHANGLFTTLSSNTTTNLSITIGGTTKSIADLAANTAAKLQTARTIWGQSFNGTANITGSLTSVTSITASGNISCNTITTTGSVTTGGNITISNGSSSRLTIWDSSAYLMQQSISDLGGYGLYLCGSSGTRIANKLVVDSNAYLKGNVGIGTISPSTKLHVVGNILSTGGITCYSSDQRAKTVIEDIDLSLKQIANAPIIRFRWNDWKIKDDGKTHIGGIAQYMQKLLPETVLEADDMLNMDYATTGYIFAVQTAKHLVKTDTEVEKLKKRVKRLEKQLKQLGYEETNIMDDKDI